MHFVNCLASGVQLACRTTPTSWPPGGAVPAVRRVRGAKKPIADELKDETYRTRRQRNNISARKSRIQHRVKVALDAKEYTRTLEENSKLQAGIDALRLMTQLCQQRLYKFLHSTDQHSHQQQHQHMIPSTISRPPNEGQGHQEGQGRLETRGGIRCKTDGDWFFSDYIYIYLIQFVFDRLPCGTV